MRAYAVRKVTHADFEARVRRIDPQFSRLGARDAGAIARPSKRPIISGIFGFLWAGMVIAVARNQAAIETSLLKGSLPQEYHVYIFGTLAALLAVSGVMVIMHLLRVVSRRGTARSNSAGILVGIAAAAMMSMVPAQTYEAGLGLLNENSRGLIETASNSVRGSGGLDIRGATFVSALGN
ncbi:hypothetical protein [Alloyangia pacifica]|uniref:Uncharacterized protein n=1 Tax=Alloyangia pacifica TaxID=311180 RepID=A0A1I6VPW7_9RHOB|nr:hypothetical protein [Alloyangia pacifica]SDI08881.1 hypothetical protein SAMN04488245_112102 [Alloyangia pacifica]SFT15756.1 hypothetical protein SAMN04488050_112102 [Alloyangia pacifica]